MDKQKSITRSKQLHQIGQDLIHRLEQVPCGLQHSQIEMQHQRKKAILSYLNASEEDWNNWQWQITHRIQTIEALTALLSLTSEQVKGRIKICQVRMPDGSWMRSRILTLMMA